MLPVVFPAVCPAFVLEPVPFEELPSVVPEFIVPSDATPGVLLVPELSLPSELPVPDEEPPFPVPEVPLEEPFVFPLLIPFESPVFPPVSFPLLLSVLPVPDPFVPFVPAPVTDGDGVGVPLIVTVGVGVVLPSPYAPFAMSSPTIGRKPAIPNGLKECVLNTMVFPFTLGIMVSVAPLSRRCSIEYLYPSLKLRILY